MKIKKDNIVPEKWLKYEILSVFDLADIFEIKSSISRYHWGDRYEAFSDVKECLLDDEKKSKTVFYVVKFVQKNLSGQLPNFRVYREKDLIGLFALLKNSDEDVYEEVWVCKTMASSEEYNVAGRILFFANNFEAGQVVEQVWHCSPRLIESYNINFKWPYVRMKRIDWGRYWKICETFIPNSYEIDTDRLMNEMREALKMLEDLNEKLEFFGKYLESFGAESYSIEYKITAGKLKVIDWDTAIDKKVINDYTKK